MFILLNPIKAKHNNFITFRLKEEGMFTNKMIFSLLVPILIEQSIIVAIEIADTVMVSYVSEAAVAGISFLTTFDNLVKKVISALAIGGSIVISQYIGSRERSKAKSALKMLFYCNVFLTLIAGIILFIMREPFLLLLTGNVEPEVMENAHTYFNFSLFSYPFFAVYFIVSAGYRAMQNSKIPMLCTIVMMAGNLILKYIFIFIFGWGVFGAGLSTLLSVMFVGIVMAIMICMPSNYIYIKQIYLIKLDFKMIKRIMRLGIPNSIENGLFQFGLVALQRLTASFGTAALAANAVVKSVAPISYIIPSAFALAIITVVGQCMGASEPGQADMYTRHILKFNYLIGLIINLLCITINNPLMDSFNISGEAISLAKKIFYIYCTGAIFLYPASFVLPNALRAAGDIKYTMIASLSTMFGARIGLAYVLGKHFGLGLLGVWIAMQLDWIARSIAFVKRFVLGKWKIIRII